MSGSVCIPHYRFFGLGIILKYLLQTIHQLRTQMLFMTKHALSMLCSTIQRYGTCQVAQDYTWRWNTSHVLSEYKWLKTLLYLIIRLSHKHRGDSPYIGFYICSEHKHIFQSSTPK